MPRTGLGVARLRGLPAVLVCALAAHALAYGSLFPDDAVHGYLAWYAPFVGALSAVALALIGALGIGELLGRDTPLRRLVEPAQSTSWSRRFASLALQAALLLLVQETLEDSLEAGRLEVGVSPVTCVLLLIAVAAVAGLLTLLARTGASVLRAVFGAAAPPVPEPLAAASWHRLGETRGRRRGILARPGGERAPPFVTC